jgi:4-azaleucine resistance transporter AzlC
MKKVLIETIPIMLGYISVGMAFGLLFVKSGFDFYLAVLMSLLVYAGSMQFVAVNLLLAQIGLFQIALITFFVNIRHMFYGLSFLDEFEKLGKSKLYMIFSLTDETYSLLSLKKQTDSLDKYELFFISLFNQIYWVTGTAIGASVGKILAFNSKGIDFAMVALFIVIFLEQFKKTENRKFSFIGLIFGLFSLLIFGPSNMIIPSMIIIVLAILFIYRLENQNG